MLKSLSENLNILMAKARVNSNELARQTGIPATTIKRMRTNEQSNPTVLTLLPIAKYFSITLSELIGDLFATSSGVVCKMADMNSAPLLTWRECVNFNNSDNNRSSHSVVLTERKISNKAFALKIEGLDSKFFPEKSILIVEPEAEPISGDFIIVTKRPQDIASIRKYIVDTDQVYLKPIIEGLNISELTSKHVILGVVIQYKVELKDS